MIAGVISYIWINGAVYLINLAQLYISGVPASHSKEEGKWKVARQVGRTLQTRTLCFHV